MKAHLATPWMPEAPRDRHWARSFSMVVSTASMLAPGSLGGWMGERSGGGLRLSHQATDWLP